jgi:hypothetical protein
MVDGVLCVVSQLEDRDPDPQSIAGLAAYPFDDPSSGFWLANNEIDTYPNYIYGRYYVTGMATMHNPFIGTFDL